MPGPSKTEIDPKVFEGLQITPSDKPLPATHRGSTAGPNVFEAPLRASVEHSRPYDVYLPPEAVKRAVFLINAAARKANLGVRVVVNVKRDSNGQVVKGKNGQAQPIIEAADSPNAGKVLVSFQGKAERKQQTAPRPYSILRPRKGETEYKIRRRSDKAIVGTYPTKETAKEAYDALKAQYATEQEQAKEAAAAAAAQTEAKAS